MYRIVYLLLSSFLFIGCGQSNKDIFSLPYYNEPTFTPIFENEKSEIEKKITHTIANFSFLNQDSVFINQELINNKIHIANFIFTSCGSICPKMTDNLKTVNDKFASDKNILFLSYSVTPWIDQPNVLKKYKKENKIDNPNWHFLTGDKSDIYKLARQSYFAEEDIGFSKDSTEFLHTEHFILVDKNKRIRGIYNGTLMLDMEQLMNDVKILKAEK
jgi:protein SCO1/2